MRRAALERPRTLRVWRAHVFGIHGGGEDIGCSCELQPGRFRKGERAGGCGNPRCYRCHFGKLTGIPTCQTWRSDISYGEWLDELGRNRPRRRYRRP